LFLLGTGVGLLPGRLRDGRRLPLSSVEGVPESWGEALLHYGDFHGLPAWMIEDAHLDAREEEPAWCPAFPVWLAATAGASTLIHTSAGRSLEDGDGQSLPAGTLALLSDHVNLSGATPLANLGQSRLGPLFPDLTALHDTALRKSALALCTKLGLAGAECVGAASLGPALETPAERRWFARAGARVAAQGLATPLLAAAHAGLGVLSIVVVTAAGDESLDIARIAAASRALAPALDDLLWELAAEVQREARAELERETDR